MKNILLIVMMGGYFTVSSQFKNSYIEDVITHAKWQTTQNVTYDSRYRKITYPNGDVPKNIGVCTDVIIRAFRNANIDLQVLVHESVKKHLRYYYPRYSSNYGEKPDANIDHRRVIILKKFFKLHYPNAELGIHDDYKPGDIIFFGNWHVGILIDKMVPGTNRYYGVHNMGYGPEMQDWYYDVWDFEENELIHYRLNLKSKL